MAKRIIITDYQMERLNTIKDYDMRESLIYFLRRIYSFSRGKRFYESRNVEDEFVSVMPGHFRKYLLEYNELIMKYGNREMLLELSLSQVKNRLNKLEKLGILKLVDKQISSNNKTIFHYRIIKE